MNSQAYLQVQAVELRRLLDKAVGDPIMEPQLRSRLKMVEKELTEAHQQTDSLLPKEIAPLPRAAIFLRGGGVMDSEGISPNLAGEVLIQYEKMFVAQALHDEREAARNAGRHRRRRGAPSPGLLFTGTPRGSFGLEFTPRPTQDVALLEVHSQSLHNIAAALLLVTTSSSATIGDAIEKIPARVLQPLKQFMKTLAQNGAELRLAFSDQPSESIGIEKVRQTAERLDMQVTQELVSIEGVFRGVTRESGIFDFNPNNGGTITGIVADHLTEEDLDRIDGLTNRSCTAELQKTVVSQIIGNATPKYVLIDAN